MNFVRGQSRTFLRTPSRPFFWQYSRSIHTSQLLRVKDETEVLTLKDVLEVPKKKSEYGLKVKVNEMEGTMLKNEQIRYPEVRVTLGKEYLGILKTREAISKARALKKELYLISSTSDPPFCKIMSNNGSLNIYVKVN